MAENKEGQEKTEEASGKRLTDARDRGQVAKSQDVTILSVLMFGAFGMFMLGDSVVTGIKNKMTYIFTNLTTIDLTDVNSINVITNFVWSLFIIIIPVSSIAFIAALIGEISQVKLKFASKKFTEGLNFKQIFNPVSGMKKIFFSKHSLFELGKSFLKLSVVGLLVYSVISDYAEETLHLMEMSVAEIGAFMVKVSLDLLTKVILLFALIAVADFFYQKRKFKNDMKMTKQETKEETKQMQGDPQIKARFRSLMIGRIRSLMMKNLKTADVVVTNPTHFAVAVKYEPGKTSAPMVIAKGADFMAAKIREEAKSYNIPIVENAPLARTLFYNVDINQEIPESLFKIIAEILAYVYNLKKKQKIYMN